MYMVFDQDNNRTEGTCSPARRGRVELDFCSVDLDINTVPRDQLPHEMLPQLFAELIDLGTQVAATGDEELCK